MIRFFSLGIASAFRPSLTCDRPFCPRTLILAAALALCSLHLHAQELPPASGTPAPTVDLSLYLPQATVQTPPTGNTSSVAASRVAASSVQSQAPAVNTPVNLDVCTAESFCVTNLSNAAQPVTVTLTYSTALAGATVVIASLDGGAINNSSGAKQVTVGTDGTVVFTFQPPAAPGLYNVVTTVGGYQRIMPFQVGGN